MIQRLIFVFFAVMLLSSCDRYLLSGFMLRTEADFNYAKFDGLEGEEYRISPNDRVMVRIYANDGFDMVNVGGGAGAASSGQSGAGSTGGAGGLALKVEFDGFVKMPIAGRVYLAGLTARQAEMLIEDWLVKYINNPFVLLEVTNRRVMLFAGANTQVITLQEENTTLFEVLAQAGGIPEDGKAEKIKLIRGDLKNPEVFVIDLSTLKGVQNADLVMQANDIIYIELRKGYVRRTFAELAPYIALVSLAITTPLLIVNLLSR
jgi:polysaccharide export outer membrane protein